jgi:hypothetical protein
MTIVTGGVTGTGSTHSAVSPDQAEQTVPKTLLAERMIGASSETGRPESTAAAEPSVVAGNPPDGDEAVQTPVQSEIAEALERVSTNGGSTDGSSIREYRRSELYERRLQRLAERNSDRHSSVNAQQDSGDALPLPRSQTLEPLDAESLALLKANQDLADSLENESISPDEGTQVAAGNAGCINGDVLEGTTDAAIKAWEADNKEIRDRLAGLPEPGDSEESGSSISSDGSDASGEPECNPALDERLSDLGTWRGILPENDPPAIAAQPNTSVVLTEMSCQDQFREDALKFLFAQSPNAGALLKAYREERGNPAAKITITRFAEDYLIACDAVNRSDAGDKKFLLTQLHGAAKDYVALIEKRGVGKKSVFGAFYLGNKNAQKSRVEIETRLCKCAGAESAEGRAALTSAALKSYVTPYIQTYLNEKLGGSVTGLTEENILKMIDSQARYALDQISAASENLIKRDGASIHGIAATLEMLMVWPDLLRNFMDALPLVIGAENLVDETEAEDDAKSEGIPYWHDDASVSGSTTQAKPSSKQAVPPGPFTGSASDPGLAGPAPGVGQPGVTNVINNYINDYSVHIDRSYNTDVSSADRQNFSSDVPPETYGEVNPVREEYGDRGSVGSVGSVHQGGVTTWTDEPEVSFVDAENSAVEQSLQTVVDVETSIEGDEENEGSIVSDVTGPYHSMSEEQDLGEDEVDSGRPDNSELARTESARTDARPDPIFVPIDPFVSKAPTYYSEKFLLNGAVSEKRGMFEHGRRLSDYGDVPIRFAERKASRSNTDLSIKDVAFAREIETEMNERLTWRQSATERSVQRRSGQEKEPPRPVILTVSRYDQYRRVGGWSQTANSVDNFESLLPVESIE